MYVFVISEEGLNQLYKVLHTCSWPKNLRQIRKLEKMLKPFRNDGHSKG